MLDYRGVNFIKVNKGYNFWCYCGFINLIVAFNAHDEFRKQNSKEEN